jgi:hypothetical protein
MRVVRMEMEAAVPKLSTICAVIACAAAAMSVAPAVAQPKMTKQQAAAACRQEVGRGSMPGSQQREINMCIRGKMGAAGKKKK